MFEHQSKVGRIEDDISLEKKQSLQNYYTEIPNDRKTRLKWPLKRLSDSTHLSPKKKLECKTSIDLKVSKNSIRESSQILLPKSECYIEKMAKLYDLDSDQDSCSSEDSIEDPNVNIKAKPRFDEYINKCYMASSDNLPGNYDLYVTNCLKFISYFKGPSYFNKGRSEIESKLKETYGELEYSSNRYLIILDMDETLVHSDLDLSWSTHDQYLKTAEGNIIPLNLRPYLFEFLSFCYEFADLAIYTASCSDYADPIVNFIEADKKYFKYRLYRDHCLAYGSIFIKDLAIFNKPLEKTIIVDNNIFSFAHYLRNGVLVSSFYNESNDMELLSLIEFFKSLFVTEDVRPGIDSTFLFTKIMLDLE